MVALPIRLVRRAYLFSVNSSRSSRVKGLETGGRGSFLARWGLLGVCLSIE
jgi:hypothetical protein